MKTNLLEAASQILNGRSSAAVPAAPMPITKDEYDHIDIDKMQDLGGDTPQKREANNPNATKGVKVAAKPGANPRVAAAPMPKMTKEAKNEDDEEETDDDDDSEDSVENKKKLKEEIEAIFAGESLSEEFKGRIATIFEARVYDKVAQIQEELEADYNQKLEESMQELNISLTEKVNDYLNYVVEEWMSENSIAIEKGLRTELTEDFMVGLRNLFAENYISIPDEEVDVVEELSLKVDELTNELNEQINIGIELAKELNESKRNEVFHSVTEGLIQTQIEKMKTLVESVDYSTEEEYIDKLEIIRENYFPSYAKVKRANESLLHEAVEEEASNTVAKISDPRMAAYAQSISRTIIK